MVNRYSIEGELRGVEVHHLRRVVAEGTATSNGNSTGNGNSNGNGAVFQQQVEEDERRIAHLEQELYGLWQSSRKSEETAWKEGDKDGFRDGL